MPWRMTRMPRPSVPWSVPRLRWPIIPNPCSYFPYGRIASPRHSGPDDAVHPTSLHTHPCPRRWFHLQKSSRSGACPENSSISHRSPPGAPPFEGHLCAVIKDQLRNLPQDAMLSQVQRRLFRKYALLCLAKEHQIKERQNSSSSVSSCTQVHMLRRRS